MKMYKIHTSIGGSLWVISVNPDEYIDARLDIRTPDLADLEYVRNGQVIVTLTVKQEVAFAAALEWIRWRK